jgi:hypothetical protein
VISTWNKAQRERWLADKAAQRARTFSQVATPYRPGVPAVIGAPVVMPKPTTWRGESMGLLCRLLPCQGCGIDDKTVVGAHRNEGKGGAIKTSDALQAALCHRCHTFLDQGKDPDRHDRRAFWDGAYIRTMQALIERGLLVPSKSLSELRKT